MKRLVHRVNLQLESVLAYTDILMFCNYKYDVHNFDFMLNVNVTLLNDYLLRRYVNHACVHRINVQF